MDKLKACPFCGNDVNIGFTDRDGNIRDKSYLEDVWRKVYYFIEHNDKDNKGCPIANHYEDGGMIGTLLYDDVEELLQKWNTRFKEKEV